jgi:hypothetical protein
METEEQWPPVGRSGATRDLLASSAASSQDRQLGEMVAELETMAMKLRAASSPKESNGAAVLTSTLCEELGHGAGARPRRPAGLRGWCQGAVTIAGEPWPAAAAIRWGGGSAREDLTRRGGRCRTGPCWGDRFFKHSTMHLTTRSPPGRANQKRGWPLLQLTGRPHDYFIFRISTNRVSKYWLGKYS